MTEFNLKSLLFKFLISSLNSIKTNSLVEGRETWKLTLIAHHSQQGCEQPGNPIQLIMDHKYSVAELSDGPMGAPEVLLTVSPGQGPQGF